MLPPEVIQKIKREKEEERTPALIPLYLPEDDTQSSSMSEDDENISASVIVISLV